MSVLVLGTCLSSAGYKTFIINTRKLTMLRVTIAIFHPSSVSSTLYYKDNYLLSLKSLRWSSKIQGCHGSTSMTTRNFNCHFSIVRLSVPIHSLLLRVTSPTTSANPYIMMDIGRIANGEPIGILRVGKRTASPARNRVRVFSSVIMG